MKVVEGEIEEQAKQALTNMKAVVEASGSSIDKVVKTTVCIEQHYFSNIPSLKFHDRSS